MKKIGFILSILIFVILALVGIALFVFPFGQNIEPFTKLGLTMIGIIGLVVRLILILGNKRLKKIEQARYENSYEYKLSQNISSAIEQAKEAGANEEKNKKIKCSFCKCTYDSSFGKCPNCGAPPEDKN